MDVYEALLASRITRLGDLPALAGLSDGQVSAAIDVLVAKGLARRSDEHIEAIRPDVALESLLAESHQRVATDMDRLAAVHREVSRLTEAFQDAQACAHPEYIEVIEGVTAIQRRQSEQTKLTRHEYLCMTHSATARLAETSEPLFDDNRALSQRGVSLRTVMPHTVADDPQGWAYAEALVSLGDDVRTCPVVPILANIADRTSAMVPLDLRDTQAGALFVRSPALVAGLVSLFELLWESGTRLSGAQPAEVDSDDRRLLALLNLGAKDEQVARAMGISVRSVRSRVARLMDVTGSRSRFQLATAASWRGWIDVRSHLPT